MPRQTFADPPLEFVVPRRAPWRPAVAAGWSVVGAAVGSAGAALGLAIGRNLRDAPPWDALPGGVGVTALLLAAAGAAYGVVVGGLAGVLLARRERIRAGLLGALWLAAVGAVGGGLGPLLAAATAGWLPPMVGSAAGCGIAGGLAGLFGYTWGGRRRRAVRPPDDDWIADPDLDSPPARPARPALVVRLWPVLTVSAACLVSIVFTPPSPAAWPMLAVGLLGLAVAWVLYDQDRRLAELEQRLRERDAEPEG